MAGMEEADHEQVVRPDDVADHIPVPAEVDGLLPPAAFGLVAEVREVLKEVERSEDRVQCLLRRARRSYRQPVDLRVEVSGRLLREGEDHDRSASFRSIRATSSGRTSLQGWPSSWRS